MGSIPTCDTTLYDPNCSSESGRFLARFMDIERGPYETGFIPEVTLKKIGFVTKFFIYNIKMM